MNIVSVALAETDFEELIKKIEDKEEDRVILARNGKPVAMLVPYVPETGRSRIGTANGGFTAPEDLDAFNDEILRLFEEESDESTRSHSAL